MSVSSLFPPFRLSFVLPDSLAAFVRPGRLCPSITGALLTVHHDLVVTIDGSARATVFGQARRFLRMIAKDRPAFIVSAQLITADRRRESWEIAVNSDVTFTRDFAPIISTEIENIGNGQG